MTASKFQSFLTNKVSIDQRALLDQTFQSALKKFDKNKKFKSSTPSTTQNYSLYSNSNTSRVSPQQYITTRFTQYPDQNVNSNSIQLTTKKPDFNDSPFSTSYKYNFGSEPIQSPYENKNDMYDNQMLGMNFEKDFSYSKRFGNNSPINNDSEFQFTPEKSSKYSKGNQHTTQFKSSKKLYKQEFDDNFHEFSPERFSRNSIDLQSMKDFNQPKSSIDFQSNTEFNRPKNPIDLQSKKEFNQPKKSIDLQSKKEFNQPKNSIDLQSKKEFNQPKKSIDLQSIEGFNQPKKSIDLQSTKEFNQPKNSIDLRSVEEFDQQKNSIDLQSMKEFNLPKNPIDFQSMNEFDQPKNSIDLQSTNEFDQLDNSIDFQSPLQIEDYDQFTRNVTLPKELQEENEQNKEVIIQNFRELLKKRLSMKKEGDQDEKVQSAKKTKDSLNAFQSPSNNQLEMIKNSKQSSSKEKQMNQQINYNENEILSPLSVQQKQSKMRKEQNCIKNDISNQRRNFKSNPNNAEDNSIVNSPNMNNQIQNQFNSDEFSSRISTNIEKSDARIRNSPEINDDYRSMRRRNEVLNTENNNYNTRNNSNYAKNKDSQSSKISISNSAQINKIPVDNHSTSISQNEMNPKINQSLSLEEVKAQNKSLFNRDNEFLNQMESDIKKEKEAVNSKLLNSRPTDLINAFKQRMMNFTSKTVGNPQIPTQNIENQEVETMNNYSAKSYKDETMNNYSAKSYKDETINNYSTKSYKDKTINNYSAKSYKDETMNNYSTKSYKDENQSNDFLEENDQLNSLDEEDLNFQFNENEYNLSNGNLSEGNGDDYSFDSSCFVQLKDFPDVNADDFESIEADLKKELNSNETD